jgi:ribose/xylose/arabinose/galactoside ABC-type transport system permease subunit
MNEPWFNPNAWSWLPGTLCGCLAGLWGALAGILVPRGKARSFIVSFGLMLVAASVAFLAAGLVAYRAGQPHGVWYGLLFPGVQGVLIFDPLILLVVLRGYREAEERRMQAEDLRF